MSRLWCLAPWCLACVPAVGVDQVRVAVRVHEAEAPDVTWDTRRLDVRAVRLRPCPARSDRLDWPAVPGRVATLPRTGSPRPWTVGFDSAYDTLATTRWRIPRGPWCALDLVMADGLLAEGTLSDGRDVSLALTLPSLGLDASAAFGARVPLVQGDIGASAMLPVVVELGDAGWLASLPLGGSEVVVDASSAAHDALVAALLASAALYEDRDDDGQVSDAERERGPLAGLVPLVAATDDTDAP